MLLTQRGPASGEMEARHRGKKLGIAAWSPTALLSTIARIREVRTFTVWGPLGSVKMELGEPFAGDSLVSPAG